MEEQGGNFPSFFSAGPLQPELLLLLVATLLLLFGVDVDSGSAMTVDDTKAAKERHVDGHLRLGDCVHR